MSRLLLDLEGLRGLIERTVSESIDAERWARAPEGSPLGRIAFADQRAEVPRGLEPNTEFERRMYDVLQSHHAYQRECVALGPVRVSEIRVFWGSID